MLRAISPASRTNVPRLRLRFFGAANANHFPGPITLNANYLRRSRGICTISSRKFLRLFQRGNESLLGKKSSRLPWFPGTRVNASECEDRLGCGRVHFPLIQFAVVGSARGSRTWKGRSSAWNNPKQYYTKQRSYCTVPTSASLRATQRHLAFLSRHFRKRSYVLWRGRGSKGDKFPLKHLDA